MGQQSWHCECQTGWRGPGCSVAMETSCADNKDNEGGKDEKTELLKPKDCQEYLCTFMNDTEETNENENSVP